MPFDVDVEIHPYTDEFAASNRAAAMTAHGREFPSIRESGAANAGVKLLEDKDFFSFAATIDRTQVAARNA
jgi:hypothetical protein